VPQRPEVARRLFRWACAEFGWDDPSRPVFDVPGDPRLCCTGLALAVELGEEHVGARLRAHAEERYEPTWDRSRGEFAYRFGLREPHPRGQWNGVIMMAELGGPGAWSRIFAAADTRRFAEPTVVGVDYPTMGVSQAFYDSARRSLTVATCLADPGCAGRGTSFAVEGLVAPRGCDVERDGEPWPRWRVGGAGRITVDTDVGEHVFVIRGGGP
jgi:hypothetical protein